MNRALRLLFIPIGLLLLLLSLEASRHRFIDPDEGFYLLAARLVSQHKTPYLDFLYTQMPLLPYIYGLWMQVFGETWLSGRGLSAWLAAGLGILLYAHVVARTGKRTVALFAALLFAGSTLAFAWLPIVKTYALCSFLLFACYMIAVRMSALSSKWTFILCGLLLGMSVEVRLYLAAVIPVFLFWILRHPKLTAKRAPILWFLGGLTLAGIPSVWLAARDVDRYIFDNVGIHAIRSGSGLIGGFGQKLAILFETLIGGPRGNGIQLGMLLVLAAWLAQKKKMLEPERLAFRLSLVLGGICLAPTPTYVQYFCIILPFLLTAVVCSIGNAPLGLGWKSNMRLTTGICVATLLYFGIAIPDGRKYFYTGEGLNGIFRTKNPGDWTLTAVRAVSRAVDELHLPGEKVMGFWPGYIFETKSSPYPGFESDCGRIFSAALSPAQVTKFHMVSPAAIVAEITLKAPRIVIIGNQEYWVESKQPYVEALKQSGYVVARRIGGASIYVRTSGTMNSSTR
jgi:4-amino-4-deoxy-L-arabinose transferase-like glycosyltransferase